MMVLNLQTCIEVNVVMLSVHELHNHVSSLATVDELLYETIGILPCASRAVRLHCLLVRAVRSLNHLNGLDRQQKNGYTEGWCNELAHTIAYINSELALEQTKLFPREDRQLYIVHNAKVVALRTGVVATSNSIH